jgi:hypothetical protein
MMQDTELAAFHRAWIGDVLEAKKK